METDSKNAPTAEEIGAATGELMGTLFAGWKALTLCAAAELGIPDFVHSNGPSTTAQITQAIKGKDEFFVFRSVGA